MKKEKEEEGEKSYFVPSNNRFRTQGLAQLSSSKLSCYYSRSSSSCCGDALLKRYVYTNVRVRYLYSSQVKKSSHFISVVFCTTRKKNGFVTIENRGFSFFENSFTGNPFSSDRVTSGRAAILLQCLFSNFAEHRTNLQIWMGPTCSIFRAEQERWRWVEKVETSKGEKPPVQFSSTRVVRITAKSY